MSEDGLDLPAMQETQVQSLEMEMVTHSSILAWRIPRTEEPGALQSTGVANGRTQSPRVRLECNPEIPVAPGGEPWLLDTSLDEVCCSCAWRPDFPGAPREARGPRRRTS